MRWIPDQDQISFWKHYYFCCLCGSVWVFVALQNHLLVQPLYLWKSVGIMFNSVCIFMSCSSATNPLCEVAMTAKTALFVSSLNFHICILGYCYPQRCICTLDHTGFQQLLEFCWDSILHRKRKQCQVFCFFDAKRSRACNEQSLWCSPAPCHWAWASWLNPTKQWQQKLKYRKILHHYLLSMVHRLHNIKCSGSEDFSGVVPKSCF